MTSALLNPVSSALLNPFETTEYEYLGVFAVGAGLTYGASRALQKEATPASIVCGAALYTLGYFVASKRPEAGWGF